MIIVPANTLAAGGFEVANSCRFNDGDSPQLHRSQPGTPTSTKIFTWSGWFKLGSSTSQITLASSFTSGSIYDQIKIMSLATHNQVLRIEAGSNEGNAIDLKANLALRDPSAWYHLVLAVDTSQGVAANRDKVYINGTQITSWQTETHSTQNDTWHMNASGKTIKVGVYDNGTPQDFFDGYLAEVVQVDGQQLTPTSFGEYDEDSPTIWKPINVSTLTFGNNGYYMDFEDSSALGNDVAGKGDFTVANLAATDQATDTPTNNFCTLNSINPRHANLTMSEGNCALASSNAQWLGTSSTIAVSAGKWYAEWKYIAGHNMKFGIVGNAGADISWLTANQSYGGYSAIGYEYQFNNSGTGYRINNDAGGSWSNGSFTAADSIIMMAFDIDAGKIWWGRNGTWFNNTGTANPATGTDASTTGISSDNAPYIISCALEGSGSTGFVNFGGCSGFAISSANQDGNGYGNFEYAVPSGFFSLCTKNLAEYG